MSNRYLKVQPDTYWLPSVNFAPSQASGAGVVSMSQGLLRRLICHSIVCEYDIWRAICCRLFYYFYLHLSHFLALLCPCNFTRRLRIKRCYYQFGLYKRVEHELNISTWWFSRSTWWKLRVWRHQNQGIFALTYVVTICVLVPVLKNSAQCFIFNKLVKCLTGKANLAINTIFD